MKEIERVKGAQRKILVNSPEPRNKVQRKVEYKSYHAITMTEIIRGNYELVYQSHGKCEIYRDTGVSKNRPNKRVYFYFISLKPVNNSILWCRLLQHEFVRVISISTIKRNSTAGKQYI